MCSVQHEVVIPHGKPKPETLFYRLDYLKDASQTWNTFHPPSTTPSPERPPEASPPPQPHWQFVAATIRNLHTRFAAHNPMIGNQHCSGPDRRAVLSLYREALAKLEHVSEVTARRIHLETVVKLSTILDLRVAQPDDDVFYIKGALLSPLEPQYAAPRLEFYDRGDGEGDDGSFWAGYGRLWEWRKEGWPRVVPWKAIERERRAREERGRDGRGMLRETASEALIKVLDPGADAVEWGEEVDADPGRPWAKDLHRRG